VADLARFLYKIGQNGGVSGLWSTLGPGQCFGGRAGQLACKANPEWCAPCLASWERIGLGRHDTGGGCYKKWLQSRTSREPAIPPCFTARPGAPGL
jgi:hypothetical protein